MVLYGDHHGIEGRGEAILLQKKEKVISSLGQFLKKKIIIYIDTCIYTDASTFNLSISLLDRNTLEQFSRISVYNRYMYV